MSSSRTHLITWSLVAATFVTTLGCGDPAGGGEPLTTSVGGSQGQGGGDGGSTAGNGGMAATTSTGGQGGTSTGVDPHPLYPPLDLATLPGDGGAESGPYESPELPTTTRTVTVGEIGAAAGAALIDACATPGTSVEVPDAAGRIGIINFGGVEDCDVLLGPDVVIDVMIVGSVPGPTHVPTHRLRVHGGQIGDLMVVGGSTDIVFDGVALNSGIVPSAQRSGGIYMPVSNQLDAVVDRFAFINSFIRLLPIQNGNEIDGAAYLGRNARNVLFANNNIVTAGNRNSWGFRIGGGDNTLLVDNTVRVSFHKLVRMNDDPVDYVYIKGGTWMREATLTSGGDMPNDSFKQLSGSTSDRVYVHDPVVYLLPDTPVTFGAALDPAQAGRSWEARRITWHALSPTVIDDARLTDRQGICTDFGGLCDYGVGTHTYVYDDALSFPASPWRDLPTFADDNPDNLPIVP